MTGRVEQVGGVTGTAQQENKLFRCSTAAEGMEGRERKSKERGVEDLGRQGREAEVRLESEEVEVGVEEEGSEMHMYISIRCCSAGRQAGQQAERAVVCGWEVGSGRGRGRGRGSGRTGERASEWASAAVVCALGRMTTFARQARSF